MQRTNRRHDPDSVTIIGVRRFSDCRVRLTSVTIGNSVTRIEAGTFAGCTGLTSVAIPDSVTALGRILLDCTALTSVTMGNSVTTIGRVRLLAAPD